MSPKGWAFILMICAAPLWTLSPARAGDLRITLPKRSPLTPVQQLNREGVEAIRKNQFEKAKTLFYRAYLYDPDDPFTLNNLGYISELEGQLDRAHRYYALAAEESTDAVIDRASVERMEGKRISEAVASTKDVSMEINRQNVEVIRLLSQGRSREAEQMARQSLALDPRNAFALNNMGVVLETEGELEQAERYYSQAAATHSTESVIVTLNRAWRGKPVSEMAAASARELRQRLQSRESVEAKASRLNLRGVAAINRNDWSDARQYFQEAYNTDPGNAFSLNNYGFLFEMDGDPETAQTFYEKARRAERANLAVGFATRRAAEGKPLFEVAADNDQKVDTKLEQAREVRSREQGPIELKRRGSPAVSEPQRSSPNQGNQNVQPQEPPLGPPQPPIPQLNPQPQGPPRPPDPNSPPQ